MVNPFLEIFLIMLVTSFACALVGNYLVLNRISLLADGISHGVLLGIALAFFIVGDLDSPVFYLMAIGMSFLVASLVEYLFKRIEISRESLIGIVFTAFFALAVILIVQFANNVHLDQDVVLLGSIETATFDRFKLGAADFGPKSLWLMGGIFLINLILITLFYKELKITAFDKKYAYNLGFSSSLTSHILTFMLGITLVTAFESVGAILVLALLTVPSVTAYLLSKRLWKMLLLSFIFAFLASGLGILFSYFAQTGLLFGREVGLSISGSVAMWSGIILVFVVFIRRLWLMIQKKQ